MGGFFCASHSGTVFGLQEFVWLVDGICIHPDRFTASLALGFKTADSDSESG